MPQQLETVDFEYTRFGNRKHDWARYFWEDLAAFVDTAQRLDLFVDELERRCANLPFNEVQKEYDYQHILMGGVSEDGKYKQRSLAQLYNEFFGLRFESLNDAISRSKEGMTVQTTVVMEETEFTSFLSDILELGEPILRQSLEEIEGWTGKSQISLPNIEQTPEMGQSEFYRLIDTPEDLVELLSDFLNQLQALLPNYDERALFLWTLEKTPRYYLELAYPKLKDPDGTYTDIESPDDLWDKFRDFFGLEPIFTPEIDAESKEDERKQQQYIIYSYWEGSLGRNLLDLYQEAWDAFDDGLRESLQVAFPDVPNFKQDFLNEARNTLEQIEWGLPENIRIVDTKEYGKRDIPAQTRVTIQAEYEIDSFLLPTCTYTTFEWEVKSRDESRRQQRTIDCDRSLSEFFDKIAPMLFLLHGLEYELDIDQESLELIQL